MLDRVHDLVADGVKEAGGCVWGGDSVDESLKGLLAEGVHFLKRGMERATGAD